MTTTAPVGKALSEEPGRTSFAGSALRAVLTQRIVLLAILIVVVVVVDMVLSAGGYMTAHYDFDYMAQSLIDAVPLAMLGLAELIVIVSGRGGIDLSIGSIVSLSGMIFGFAYGEWGWPFWLGLLLCAAVGTALGTVNGFLVAKLGFPALIATLATYYAYKSVAVVINNQSPISTVPIQSLYSITRSVELPFFGQYIPNIPLGVFTFLLPVVVVGWLILARGTYGRRLYGIGTNDVAARFSGINVAGTRMRAYALSGLIAGLAAVYLTGEFTSARPDAGTSGNGLALPAITIAVLGGVAITGGIGRVAGVVLATLLVTWLNAGILLSFEGNAGTQYQLLALGIVLIFAALLNGLATRRYGGAK
ncbi:MAG: ABC transporter permease [Actinomycetota bacterium]|nr:ABC transporter permease [Actinomycetota bacterium]